MPGIPIESFLGKNTGAVGALQFQIRIKQVSCIGCIEYKITSQVTILRKLLVCCSRIAIVNVVKRGEETPLQKLGCCLRQSHMDNIFRGCAFIYHIHISYHNAKFLLESEVCYTLCAWVP